MQKEFEEDKEYQEFKEVALLRDSPGRRVTDGEAVQGLPTNHFSPFTSSSA
jgi:hypothetical protein